jgi:acyl carrier protein
MTDSSRHGTEPTAIEQTVTRIWRDLLSTPAGAQGTSFLELGGESISAVRIVSRVGEALGVEVDVADLFDEDPTLADFIRMVSAKAAPPAAA